jgi:rubrerythrin
MVVEKMHHDLYAGALAAVKAGGDLPEAVIQVCDICGCTLLGDAPDTCPVCGAKKEHFNEVK